MEFNAKFTFNWTYSLHTTEASDIVNYIDDFVAIDDIDLLWEDIYRYKTKKNARPSSAICSPSTFHSAKKYCTRKDFSDYTPKQQNSIAKYVVWPTLREATADLVHESSNTRNVDDMIRAATRPLHSESVMPKALSSCPLAESISANVKDIATRSVSASHTMLLGAVSNDGVLNNEACKILNQRKIRNF